MDTAQLIVNGGGVAAIGFILWFFFAPRGATAAREGRSGVQEVEVVVQGGYTPDRIEVRQGRPVRLIFLRKESNPCTEQVVLADFGITRSLPEGVPVSVEFTPDRSGDFTFHCSMNMVRGTLKVLPKGVQLDSSGSADVADNPESRHTH